MVAKDEAQVLDAPHPLYIVEYVIHIIYYRPGYMGLFGPWKTLVRGEGLGR